MKILKMIGVLLYALLSSNNALSAFPADPDYMGPYMCIHQDIPLPGTKLTTAPQTLIYGVVTSEFERCNEFNINSASNTTVTPFELNTVLWQDESSTDPSNVTEYVNNLDLFEKRHSVTDPSCRFGIIF